MSFCHCRDPSNMSSCLAVLRNVHLFGVVCVPMAFATNRSSDACVKLGKIFTHFLREYRLRKEGPVSSIYASFSA